MSIVITDKSVVEQLSQASGTVEVRDASGNLLGTFAPPSGKLPAGVSSPFTTEDLARRRLEPDGRSLSEILGDLEQRG
jgi:hypothetical protein